MTRDIKWTDLMKPEDVSIELCWKIYSGHIFKGKEIHPIQYNETKQAFYAGFVECFKIMNDFSTELTEDQACTALSRINDEAHIFVKTRIQEMQNESQRSN